MDILDIFGHFYLNHLSPLWRYFLIIHTKLVTDFVHIVTRFSNVLLQYYLSKSLPDDDSMFIYSGTSKNAKERLAAYY